MLEIWREARKFSKQRLVVEKNLSFVYPAYVFYFVHPDNNLLGDAIENGLHSAIADGSFDILFNSVEGDALKKANLAIRKFIHLDNPNVSEKGVYQWPNILGN